MLAYKKLAVACGLAFCAATAHASDVGVVFSKVSADEVFGLDYAYDGIFPSLGQAWTDNTAYWFGSGEDRSIVFEFDRVYTVKSFDASIDNNDSYVVQFSLDGKSWDATVSISPDEGGVGWGMDRFQRSVDPTPARYARVFASYGDDLNSVGELKILAAVPEPEAYAMFLAGIGLIGAIARRRRQK